MKHSVPYKIPNRRNIPKPKTSTLTASPSDPPKPLCPPETPRKHPHPSGIPLVILRKAKQSNESRVRKGQVSKARKGQAEVTVPTASSRKANSLVRSRAAFPRARSLARSRLRTCLCAPEHASHTRSSPRAGTQMRKNVGLCAAARARTCKSTERRYASRARAYPRASGVSPVCVRTGISCMCSRVWRGLVAARLPASALGCAARQDVEPSATQPGDHPRVQAGLLLLSTALSLLASSS